MRSLKQSWLSARCDGEPSLPRCADTSSVDGCLSQLVRALHNQHDSCALRTALCFDFVAADPMFYNCLRPELQDAHASSGATIIVTQDPHVQISSGPTLSLKTPDLRTKCCWSPRMASRMRRS